MAYGRRTSSSDADAVADADVARSYFGVCVHRHTYKYTHIILRCVVTDSGMSLCY